MNAKFDRYENKTSAFVSWTLVTGAESYKVFYGDTQVGTTQGANGYYVNFTAPIKETAYQVVVKAYDSTGAEIATDTVDMPATEPEVTTTEGPQTRPDDNYLEKVDTSAWVALDIKKGASENVYYINKAGSDVLNHSEWWGIYVPHSEASYHNERVNCILGDAAAFIFMASNVKSVWVNGNYYANHSTGFNNDGNCCEVSVDTFTEEQNVVTLVNNDGTMTTFAIKISAPLGPDATEEAEQTTIDKDTITDWVKLNGVSKSGAMAFISQASANKMGNGSLRGFYAPKTGMDWNRLDTNFWDMNVFGFVANNANASDIVINGVKYINAKDKRNEKVYIGSDCVYINQELVDAAPGEENYYTITATGSAVDTFLLKVVGVKVPVGVSASSPEAGKISVVWGQDLDMANAGYTYNVYLDDAETPVLAGVTANTYTIDAAAGQHTVTVKSLVNGNESAGVTVNVNVEDAAVTTYNVSIDGTVVDTVEEGKEYTLPAIAEYGYYADGAMYKAGTTVTVNSEIAFTSVNTLSVTAEKGAGIRLVNDDKGAGIRFQATVSSDNMTAVESAAITEGMLITANDLYEAKGESALDFTSTYTYKNIVNNGWYNGTVGTYCGSIVKIVESNYIRSFIARAYVTVTYSDGSTKTVYSNMTGARSIQGVATAIKNAGYPNIAEADKALVDKFAAAK